MKMNMISPQELEFRKEILNLLASIDKELRSTQKDQLVEVNHGHVEFAQGNILISEESSKEQVRDALKALQEIRHFKKLVQKLVDLGVLKTAKPNEVGFEVSVDETRLNQLQQEYAAVSFLPAIYYEHDSGVGYVNNKKIHFSKNDDTYKIFPLLLSNCNAPVDDKEMFEKLDLIS